MVSMKKNVPFFQLLLTVNVVPHVMSAFHCISSILLSIYELNQTYENIRDE